MSDGKVLLMGVGGCGSGFVWNVLRRCGLETTEHREWMRQSGIRTAVKEGTHLDFHSPKVIKHLGGFMTNLNQHLDTHQWEVEHIYLCMASFDLQMHNYKKRRKDKDKPADMEFLTDRYFTGLGRGMVQIAERDHPFSIIRCPRSIKEPEYLYSKLKCVLDGMTYEEYLVHHEAQISPRHLRRLDGYS
jgi:hypothetical protein